MKILYIIHYGYALREFYFDKKTNKPIKIIGDGGSNIHIHLIQYLNKRGERIFLSTYKNNYQYIAFFETDRNIRFVPFWTLQSISGYYISLLENLYKIFILPLKAFLINTEYDSVVSTSDFFPDVFYSFIIKIRNPKIKWVASYFLEAPSPWAKNNPYRTSLLRYLTGVLYWSMQRFSYFLIKWKADFILVTSEPDVQRFITEKRNKSQIIVAKGGVDIDESEKYLSHGEIIPVKRRKYDACFVGRFHYQKGCLEMVDIWKKVCDQNPNAKLAMIGNGPLEKDVEEKIQTNSLEKNIDLLGYKYGMDKFEIFKDSKIIVHPSTYDSGGMAAAEGMAWGLPGVSFDLEALRTYYPKGMIKTPVGNLMIFADNILKLLKDEKLYNKIKEDAVALIREEWNWNKRAEDIFQRIKNQGKEIET